MCNALVQMIIKLNKEREQSVATNPKELHELKQTNKELERKLGYFKEMETDMGPTAPQPEAKPMPMPMRDKFERIKRYQEKPNPYLMKLWLWLAI